jgi:hypothetical protein
LAKQLVNKMGWDGPTVNQSALYHAVLCAEGLRPEQFTILPQLSHADLAREMANTDVGLFPNRCEGGTNLVLMEYAALGRLVIANVLTGHADVAGKIAFTIEATENAETRWAEQRIADIVEMIEDAQGYQLITEAPRWPWSDAAEKIVTTARKYFARLK